MKCEPQVKYCADCLTKFIRTNNHKSYCPKCSLKRSREWHSKHPQKGKKYIQKWWSSLTEQEKKEVRKRRRLLTYSRNDSSPKNRIDRLWQNTISNERRRQKEHSSWKGKPIIDVDKDFLYELYNKQNGLCALSNLKMTNKRNDLRSISIDRIDSNQPYTKTNIQLVCKWVNLAKNTSTNGEVLSIIKEIRLQGEKR